MLSRLSELRAFKPTEHFVAAVAEGEEGQGGQPPQEGQYDQDEAARLEFDIPKTFPIGDQDETEAELDEYLEFLDDMHEHYTEILADEGTTKQACEEIRHNVENMEETMQLEKQSLLPGRLDQLSDRFECQELVCQRMINRAKDVLESLKKKGVEKHESALESLGSNDDRMMLIRLVFPNKERMVHLVPQYLEPVRQSIAKVRAAEYKKLVLRFFTCRSANKAEVLRRTHRQLKFAFPNALEYELHQVMEFPENAMLALSLRLEKGDKIVLEHFIEEIAADPEKDNQRKLEQGAKELRLMMLQFSELIDNQGEQLDAIEANIKTVLDQTSEAIGMLSEAIESKKKFEETMRRLRAAAACFMCMVALMLLKVLSKWLKIFGLAPSPPAADLQLFSVERANHSHHQIEFHVSGAYRVPRDDLQGAQRNYSRPGFFAPRASLLENPVLRGVALTARGTAAKQSVFRKRRAVLLPDADAEE